MMSKLTFHRKPMPILAEHRPLYKITQVLLILYLASRGKKSSLIRLHLISWVLKDERRKTILLESVRENKILFGVWGVDPAVNFSLQFAIAEGLIKSNGPSYELTIKGTGFIAKIGEDDFLKKDYKFLVSLELKVTEAMVQKIVGEWT
jgi:hypothetical protein